MFLLSIAWYGVQGLSTGLVSWQTQYDENGYGALMVLGLAFAFPFARAARMTSWRVVAFATAALGIAGSVVSLARGAFLALIAVAAFLWIRSPRKIYGIFAAAAGIIVLLIVVEVRYPGGTFWVEMSTIDDAAEAPEHQERWVINNLALEVFKRYPVFGVGANNFGPVAARTITPDDNRSAYSNPATVWGRTLHNDYLQVLVEQGVVGFVLYAWMIVDFFRRTSAMRRPDLTRRWRTESGGRLELVLLTIGLEAGMIAYLVTALVYPQLYFHWFYTLITLAGTLWAVCKGLPHAQRSAEPLRSARGAGTSEAASPAAGRRTFGDLLADGPNGASRARLYTEDANR
jgi:O-antigen ligase